MSPTTFSRQACCMGNTVLRRSSERTRSICGATALPALRRKSASEREAHQRQRVPKTGAPSTACSSTLRGRFRAEVRKNGVELEAVDRAEGEQETIVGSGSL